MHYKTAAVLSCVALAGIAWLCAKPPAPYGYNLTIGYPSQCVPATVSLTNSVRFDQKTRGVTDSIQALPHGGVRLVIPITDKISVSQLWFPNINTCMIYKS